MNLFLKLLNNPIDCPYWSEQLNYRINNKSTRNQDRFLNFFFIKFPNILMTKGTDIYVNAYFF